MKLEHKYLCQKNNPVIDGTRVINNANFDQIDYLLGTAIHIFCVRHCQKDCQAIHSSYETKMAIYKIVHELLSNDETN